VLYVRQLLLLKKMARARGIGMPRAKKKKVNEVQPAEEDPVEDEDADEPPPPPSPPPKPKDVKPPPSPSKTKLTNAQRDLRRQATAANKEGIEQMAAAASLMKAAVRKYTRKNARIESDARRQLPLKPPRPAQLLIRSYEAEQELDKAEIEAQEITAIGYKILWRAAQIKQCALLAQIGLLRRQCRLYRRRRGGRL
jgi:hypothetical protein